jgi:Flp pilus assembly pilin Flp
MTDRSFQEANDESRRRLASLVASLTPAQLEVDLGEGWTVASALAHTGFWDRWQAARWTEMLAGQWAVQEESVIAAEHLANEALHPYWAGIGSESVGDLGVAAATRLDSLIAGAPDALVDELEGSPSAYLLHRYRHRNDHLDHIERALAAASGAGPMAEAPGAAEAERNGQGLVEYALILSLIAIVAVSALLFLGGGINMILSVVGSPR